jgi:hypothetical protein
MLLPDDAGCYDSITGNICMDVYSPPSASSTGEKKSQSAQQVKKIVL